MADNKTEIEFVLNTKDAQRNVKDLTEQLRIQEGVLIDLEKQTLALQKKRDSGLNLAGQKVYNDKIKENAFELRAERLALKDLNNQRKNAVTDLGTLATAQEKSVTNGLQQNKIFVAVNKLTGGLASKTLKYYKGLKQAGKAIKVFNAGLSGMKKALIATGIGALVVALGLVVAYWDDIVKLFQDANKELVDQEAKINKTIDAQTVQLGLLKQQIGLQELQTGESKKLTKEYRKQLIIQREQNIALLENLLAQEQLEDSKSKELTFWEKTKIAVAGVAGVSLQASLIADTYIGKSAKSVELQKKINDARSAGLKIETEIATLDNNVEAKAKKRADEKKAKQKVIDDAEIEAERLKAEAIERIRKGLIDTEAEERAEKLRLIQVDYNEQIALAEEFYGKESEQVLALRSAQDNAKKEQQKVFDDADKAIEDEKTLKEQEELIKKLTISKENDALDFEEQRENVNAKRAILLEDETLSEEQRAELLKTYSDAEFAIEEKKRAQKQQTLDNAITLAGADSKLGKALLVAKQLVLAQEMILDIKSAIATAKSSAIKTTVKSAEAGVDVASGGAKAVSSFAPPFNIPIILGYAVQAVGIISSIKSAMSASKSATSKLGVSGGTPNISAPVTPSPSIPPAFNVVGSSSTSQLADSIGGQSQAPIQTFVVANDVTTAQGLENNIIEGASLG